MRKIKVKIYKIISCHQRVKVNICLQLNQKLIPIINLLIELFQAIIQKKMILLNPKILALKKINKNWRNWFTCVQIQNLTY
jgi:hypothetical protein